jgi:hypothetical protein
MIFGRDDDDAAPAVLVDELAHRACLGCGVVVHLRRRDQRVLRDPEAKQDFPVQIELRLDVDPELFETEDTLLRVRARDDDARRVARAKEIGRLERTLGKRPCEDDDGVGLRQRIFARQKMSEVNEGVGACRQGEQRDDREDAREFPAPLKERRPSVPVDTGAGWLRLESQPSIRRMSPARGPLDDSSGWNSTRCPSRSSSKTAPRTALR